MLTPLRIFTAIVFLLNCSILIFLQDFRLRKKNDNSAHHRVNTIKDPASEHYSVIKEGKGVRNLIGDESEDQINKQRKLLSQKSDINDVVDARSLKKSVLEELKNIQSKIFETWGEERESFFTSVQFGNSYTREETRHYVKRKMMKAFAEQGTFTITTLGTSVAASHDNRYNQSFTAVLEQALKPLFTNVGVDLVVNNHAMGANPVNPMHYCVGTLGDLDTDLYLYEFEMMLGSQKQGDFENFLRSAISQPNQPIVTYLHASPHKNYKNLLGKRQFTFAGLGDSYLGGNHQLQQHYRGFGINYWSFIAAVMFNGAQNDTRFQSEYCISDKPFQKKKPWHPGPHGHEAVGMALAYSYALVFADAVQSVLELKNSGHHIDPKVLDNPRATLPEAYNGPCKSDPFCVSPNTTCYTSFEPKGEANMDLGNFVMNANYEDTRPTLPTPCGQPEGQTCVQYHGLKNWLMGIWPQDEKAVIEGMPAGYADRKWSLLGRNTSGELELELEAPHSGTQFMYCHPCGDFGRYPSEVQGATQNYTVKVNGAQVQQEQIQSVSTKDMCAVVNTKIEPGKIKMFFQAPDEKLVAISHIVFP